MKAMWLCNIPFPDIARALNLAECQGGGWMTGPFNRMATMEGMELTILFPVNNGKGIHKISDNVTCCGFRQSRRVDRYSSRLEAFFKRMLGGTKPDIVHIWGTEYPHSLAMVNACMESDLLDRAIIYMQGVCSEIALHYRNGLPEDIARSRTIRDIVRRDGILQQEKRFARCGGMEIDALRKIKHIIGRTDFDKAYAARINPLARYHYCGEAMRDSFFGNRWQLEKCERHSIFLSQGNYPIKGLHFVIEAMPLILERFPDAHLYVAGQNIVKYDTAYDKIKITGYGLYIRRLISKNGLWSHITFTGVLDEREMCERYLKSHAFVSASSIENSPNSLGEAMLLGVPAVASDVGGVKNLMKHGEDGFVYQADAPYMLAFYVCKVFSDDILAASLSANARRNAAVIYDRTANAEGIMKIYREMMR